MSKSFVNKVLVGGALAAGAAVWAIAPRTFSDKRRNYVPAVPDVWYAHRGLHMTQVPASPRSTPAKAANMWRWHVAWP